MNIRIYQHIMSIAFNNEFRMTSEQVSEFFLFIDSFPHFAANDKNKEI